MCRRAKPNDVKAILGLNEEFLQYTIKIDPNLEKNKKLIEETIKELRDRILFPQKYNDKPVFVVERDNKIIGFVTGVVKNIVNDICTAEMENIFVTEDYRWGGIKYLKGTGSKLSKKFISRCKKNQNRRVIAEYYRNDVNATLFYGSRSMNFLPTRDKSTDPNKIRAELALEKA